MGAFVDFAVDDAARCELLFHRPIPGFEPSPESYAIAEAVLGRAGELLHAAGMSEPGDVDCFVAMIAGLIDAQISNDPGGDRWTRHLDRLDRPVPRRRHHQEKEPTPMNANRIQRARSEGARGGGVPALRRARRVAHRRRVDAAHRLRRVGRPQDGAARARLGRRAGVVPASSCTSCVRGVPLNRQIDSHHWVDGMNELQIRERAHLSNDEVVAQLEAVGPKAVAGRWRTPAPMRHLPIPFGPPVGWVGAQVPPRRRLHPRRVGPPHRPLRRDRPRRWSSPPTTTAASSPTSSPSGRSIHGQPFELVLEGPAGGKFSQGATASASRSTPSSSSASSPVAAPAPASSANPLPL